MKLSVIDGTPIPTSIAYPCQQVSQETGQALVSGYRGSKDSGLLRRLGKMTQQALWDAWVRRLPWANPANPPGRSTHECFNDGVAYWGPPGRALFDWQCGMDWVNGARAVQRFRALGYSAMLTYPNNAREKQHVNLTRKPRVSIWRLRPLKQGSQGRRVKYLKHQLHYIHDPDTKKPYFAAGHRKPKDGWGKWFDKDLEAAVRRFQRDHGQAADGVVGFNTKKNVDASYKTAQRRAKEGKR